jgi:hypothetical protein
VIILLAFVAIASVVLWHLWGRRTLVTNVAPAPTPKDGVAGGQQGGAGMFHKEAA